MQIIEKKILQGTCIAKGRKSEVGMLPEKYHRKEIETPSSRKRTEQGVNFRLSFRMGAHQWIRLYLVNGRKAFEALDKYRREGRGKQRLEDISNDSVYFGNVAIRFR
jgi:hypothetical protein